MSPCRPAARCGASSGFSVIELLVVASIVVLLVAMVVPNLLRAQQRALEVSTIASLRSTQASQTLFHMLNGHYATRFRDLETLLPTVSRQGSGEDTVVRSRYVLRLRRAANGRWSCTADPVNPHANDRYFYTDQSSILRMRLGTPADESSPAWDAGNKPVGAP